MTRKGVRLAEVLSGSPAARARLTPGIEILAVDGQPVADVLDLSYGTAEPEFTLDYRDTHGHLQQVHIARKPGRPWGGVAEPPPVKRCGNRCVFCFVDQMPEGLRPSLYVKDEDYRHSFLFGNYVTLTNLQSRDWQRIIDLRLSPLYVSVHATDPAVRARLLGRPQAPPILPILRMLARGGIDMHAQAVLCPGWNDGAALTRTVQDLSVLYPSVRSLALVPVGLTRHRGRLTALTGFSAVQARRVLARLDRWQARFKSALGTRWVFAADEWYFKAGQPVPSLRAYEDFPQLENGVGLARRFIEALRPGIRKRPSRVRPARRVLLASGEMAAPLVARLLTPLRRVAGLDLEIIPVPNQLFGTKVTVGGLMSGADVLAAVAPRVRAGDLLLLPPEPLRHQDQRFLDDMDLGTLARRLGVRVQVVPEAKQLVSSILRG